MKLILLKTKVISPQLFYYVYHRLCPGGHLYLLCAGVCKEVQSEAARDCAGDGVGPKGGMGSGPLATLAASAHICFYMSADLWRWPKVPASFHFWVVT